MNTFIPRFQARRPGGSVAPTELGLWIALYEVRIIGPAGTGAGACPLLRKPGRMWGGTKTMSAPAPDIRPLAPAIGHRSLRACDTSHARPAAGPRRAQPRHRRVRCCALVPGRCAFRDGSAPSRGHAGPAIRNPRAPGRRGDAAGGHPRRGRLLGRQSSPHPTIGPSGVDTWRRVRAQWLWSVGDERGVAAQRSDLAAYTAKRGARIRDLRLLAAGAGALVSEERFEEARAPAELAIRRARRARDSEAEAEGLAVLGTILAAMPISTRAWAACGRRVTLLPNIVPAAVHLGGGQSPRAPV